MAKGTRGRRLYQLINECANSNPRSTILCPISNHPQSIVSRSQCYQFVGDPFERRGRTLSDARGGGVPGLIKLITQLYAAAIRPLPSPTEERFVSFAPYGIRVRPSEASRAETSLLLRTTKVSPVFRPNIAREAKLRVY
jgi:hypothetical protein